MQPLAKCCVCVRVCELFVVHSGIVCVSFSAAAQRERASMRERDVERASACERERQVRV